MADNETEPPPQEPFADAPCDAQGCTRKWEERVEWVDGLERVQTRYACARHAYLYLKSGELPRGTLQ